MKNLLFIPVVAILLVGCVATSQDLQRLADRQAEQEQEISAALAEYANGQKSLDEVTEAISDAWGETGREIRNVAETVKERAESTASQTIDMVLTGLASVLLGVPVAVGTTNRLRNAARERRGEAV